MALLTYIPHEKFAQHYAVHGNMRKAVADLGLNGTREAKHLLYLPKIQARIEELVGESFREARISVTRTLHELARVAYFDIRDLYHDDGTLKAIHELDDDTAAGIARIDVEMESHGRGKERETIVTKKIRTADKIAALGLLARHYKLVGSEDDGVNALANALADRLKSGRRRASVENAEDATIHRAEAVLQGGQRMEYGFDEPDDGAEANNVNTPRLAMPERGAEDLHSRHDTPVPVQLGPVVRPERKERSVHPVNTAQPLSRTMSAAFGITPAPSGALPAGANPSVLAGDDDEDFR